MTQQPPPEAGPGDEDEGLATAPEPGTEEQPPAEPEQVAFDVHTFPGGARSAIEAVLMVVDEPVDEVSLATALEIPVDDVVAHLTDLQQDYDGGQRGFTLRHVGGGWRIYSASAYAPVVEKFMLDGRQAKLTQASLETLAVIAYRQPISRSRVSSVRGVNVDGVVRTLLSRDLIEEVGTEEESGATLYGTTGYFLERLGLGSLEELPALAPYLPEVDVLDELAERGRS